MRKIAFGVAAVAAIASSPALAAGTATGTVEVSLNVSSSCSVTAQPLDFGSTTAFTANLDSSSATTVKCTPDAAYTVLIDNGLNASGTQRQLKSSVGSTFVSYDVYTDTNRGTAWPSTGVLGVGTGFDQAMTIFGRVPSQTAVPAGDYKDTLTVTVNY